MADPELNYEERCWVPAKDILDLALIADKMSCTVISLFSLFEIYWFNRFILITFTFYVIQPVHALPSVDEMFHHESELGTHR